MLHELIRELEEMRTQHAHATLHSPAAKTEFEFGRVSGMYQGLTVAIEAVMKCMADNDEDTE